MPETELLQHLLTVPEPPDGLAFLDAIPADPEQRTAWNIARFDGDPKDAALQLAKAAGWAVSPESAWALNEDESRWEVTIEIQNAVEQA